MSEPRIATRLMPWLAGLGAAVICLPALWHLGALAWIFWSHLSYPMDLEWMEGGTLYQAWRILHGLPLYGPPSQGFVAYTYPPAHSAIVAAAGWIFGLDYGVARAVSVAGALVVMGSAGVSIWRADASRTQRVLWIVLAAGAIAATTPLHTGWFALIRNDSIALAFPCLAAALALRPMPWPRPWRAVVIGLLLMAAVFTKQTGVFFAAWIVLFIAARDRRRGLLAASVALIAALLVWGWLHTSSGGWFTEWMFMSRKHKVYPGQAMAGFKTLVTFAPYVGALPLVVLGLAVARKLSAGSVLWSGMLLAAIPASLLPFAKVGGFVNNLMPFVCIAPIAASLLLLDLVRALRRLPVLAQVTAVLGAMAFAVHLADHHYKVEELVPSAELRARAAKLEGVLRSLGGCVVIPNHPFLAVRIGATCEQFHTMAYLDALTAGEPGVDLSRYLARIDGAWAVLDGQEGPYVTSAVLEHFVVERAIVDGPNMVIGGGYVAPSLLLRRAGPKHDVKVVFDFETDGLAGWTREGNAFEANPTHGAVRDQGPVTGALGCCLINSFRSDTHDGARGVVISPTFTIDRAYLGVRVGGGMTAGTRAELHVQGQVVNQASGFDTEHLVERRWFVGPYQGQEAQLWVIDETDVPWGHVLVDQAELFNSP